MLKVLCKDCNAKVYKDANWEDNADQLGHFIHYLYLQGHIEDKLYEEMMNSLGILMNRVYTLQRRGTKDDKVGS